MRILLILLILSISILAQEKPKSVFKGVNPSIYENKKLSNAAKSPNELDSEGNRTGRWTIFIEKSHKETENPNHITYYRVANFKNGQYIGDVKDYNFDGELVAEGNFDGNDWDGEVKFYENGKLSKIKTFKNQMQNGIYKKFAEDTSVKVIGYYKDDKKDSIWTINYSKDKVKAKGYYLENAKQYWWIYYNEDGTQSKSNFLIENEEHDFKSANKQVVSMIVSNYERSDAYYEKLVEYNNVAKLNFKDEINELKGWKYYKDEDCKNFTEVFDSKVTSTYDDYQKLIIGALDACYYELNQHDKRIELISKAITATENNPKYEDINLPLYARLAEIYYENEDYKKLEEVLQQSPIYDICTVKNNKLILNPTFLKYMVLDNNLNQLKPQVKNMNFGLLDLIYYACFTADKNNNETKLNVLKQFLAFAEESTDFYNQQYKANRIIVIENTFDRELIEKYK